MGCILVDRQRDGLSAVYSFFRPEEKKRSLGSFMIVDLIDRCNEIGLPYVYLGYYIEQSRKMSYKAGSDLIRYSVTGSGRNNSFLCQLVQVNRAGRGKPIGGIRPALPRRPCQASKSVSVRVLSPIFHDKPSARLNVLTSARVPSL